MELLVLTALCALIGLGCLGGAAFAVLGAEDVGVERIFILLVWMMFAAMFLGLAAWIARQGPLRKKATAPLEPNADNTATKAASKNPA